MNYYQSFTKSDVMKISRRINRPLKGKDGITALRGYYGLYARFKKEIGSGWYLKITDGYNNEIVSIFNIKELMIFLEGIRYGESNLEYMSKCSYQNLIYG